MRVMRIAGRRAASIAGEMAEAYARRAGGMLQARWRYARYGSDGGALRVGVLLWARERGGSGNGDVRRTRTTDSGGGVK